MGTENIAAFIWCRCHSEPRQLVKNERFYLERQLGVDLKIFDLLRSGCLMSAQTGHLIQILAGTHWHSPQNIGIELIEIAF